MYERRRFYTTLSPGDKLDEVGAPLVGVVEGGRWLGRYHEDGAHWVDFTVRSFSLGHLQCSDAKTPIINI
jgi:hypothetical protein